MKLIPVTETPTLEKFTNSPAEPATLEPLLQKRRRAPNFEALRLIRIEDGYRLTIS